MPWKKVTAVNERMQFVARLKAGERMTDLCREFGISRKTGYKFERRYEERGPSGLYDVSRRPRRLARQVSAGIQTAILDLKRDQPTWGAAKIQEVLRRRHPEMDVPVRSTIHDLLDRYGLVQKRSKRRRYHAYPTLREQDIQAPNQLWCADFKGQFRMGNAKYCYPLTVSDFHTRYLLGCEAMESTQSESAQQGFEWIFREYGLPTRLRTDNGFRSLRDPYRDSALCRFGGCAWESKSNVSNPVSLNKTGAMSACIAPSKKTFGRGCRRTYWRNKNSWIDSVRILMSVAPMRR